MSKLKLGQLFLEYVEKYGDPGAPTNVEETRKYMMERGRHNQSLLEKPPFDILEKPVAVENTTIELPEVPGHKFPVRIYRPRGYSGPSLPIYLYFHSGYWCAGDSNAEDFGCRAIIARGVQIVIVSFEYRLAPETPWYEIFSDCENAMKWVAGNAKSFGADTDKGFIIGGATSGAHLAAICAIRARDRHPEIRLTGQILIVPTTIAWPDDEIPEGWKMRLSSHTEMANAPIVNEKLYEYYVRTLGVPKHQARKGENFPCWGPLEGLPPAYVPTDECDPTRDQGFLYAELLFEAGVKTRTDYYRGLPNMFVQFPELSTTLEAGIKLSAAMRWLLQERK